MLEALFTYRHQLLAGAQMTLLVAVASLAFATVLGIAGAAAKLYGPRYAVRAANGYTLLVRGVPELIVIFLIYFGGTVTLSKIAGRYLEVQPFFAGVVSLGVVFGAYMTEVFRGAILAVPRGQVEAAHSLALSQRQAFLLVTLPQAWRYALPSYGNQWLILLKHSSLISVVGLEELMRKSVIVAGATRQPFVIYCSAAAVYLVMTLTSMLLLRKVERHVERGLKLA